MRPCGWLNGSSRIFPIAEHGGFFTTAADHESLIVRSREGPDGATPSANAVAAMVLARLSYHYARDDFRTAATDAVRAYGRPIARYPRAFAKSLSVADLLLNGPMELALVGMQGDPAYETLRAEVNRHYLPNRILAHYDPQGPDPQHPLTRGKTLVTGRPALYVCRNFACQTPITDPSVIDAAVEVKRSRRRHGGRLGDKSVARHTDARTRDARGNRRICRPHDWTIRSRQSVPGLYDTWIDRSDDESTWIWRISHGNARA